jgi:hypothetical protein
MSLDLLRGQGRARNLRRYSWQLHTLPPLFIDELYAGLSQDTFDFAHRPRQDIATGFAARERMTVRRAGILTGYPCD